MARQHVRIGAAAKPEHTQRQLHEFVVGFDRIGHIPVLVRPICRTGQRALARQQQEIPGFRHVRPGQSHLPKLLDNPFALIPPYAKAGRPAVGPHTVINLLEKRRALPISRSLDLLKNRQRRQVRRRLKRKRIARHNRNPLAVHARCIKPPPQPVRNRRARGHGNHVQVRLLRQRRGQIAVRCPVNQTITVPDPGSLQNRLRLLRPGRLDFDLSDVVRIEHLRPGVPSLKRVDTALVRHHEQTSVRRHKPGGGSLHLGLPANRRRGTPSPRIHRRHHTLPARVQPVAGHNQIPAGVYSQRPKRVHNPPFGPDHFVLPGHTIPHPPVVFLLFHAPHVPRDNTVPQGIENVFGQNRQIAEPGNHRLSGGNLVQTGHLVPVVIDEPVAQRADERPARLVVIGVPVIEERPCLAVKTRGHRTAARHQQLVPGHDHCPLRRHPAVGRRIVGLQKIHRPAAVVGPDGLPGLRIQRVDEHPHKRPDARREIDHTVCKHRPAPRRPGRNQPLVPQQLPVGRPPLKPPQQFPPRRIHAVEIPVIADKIDLPLRGHRRKAHRAARVKRPLLPARHRIQRHHPVARIAPHEKRLPHHNRLVDPVVLHQIPVQRIVPHRLDLRILAYPLQVEVIGQAVRRRRAAARIVPPHRPVARETGSRRNQNRQKDEQHKRTISHILHK